MQLRPRRVGLVAARSHSHGTVALAPVLDQKPSLPFVRAIGWGSGASSRLDDAAAEDVAVKGPFGISSALVVKASSAASLAVGIIFSIGGTNHQCQNQHCQAPLASRASTASTGRSLKPHNVRSSHNRIFGCILVAKSAICRSPVTCSTCRSPACTWSRSVALLTSKWRARQLPGPPSSIATADELSTRRTR